MCPPEKNENAVPGQPELEDAWNKLEGLKGASNLSNELLRPLGRGSSFLALRVVRIFGVSPKL